MTFISDDSGCWKIVALQEGTLWIYSGDKYRDTFLSGWYKIYVYIILM